MPRVLEKVERRLGEKLLIKGDRCVGPKCAAVRRGYPPGVHGKNRKRRRNVSEFGELMREKQKIRYLYNLDDNDVKRYSNEAASKPGIFSENFLRMLESRLDNVVFRLGLVTSRRGARQLVGHGHVMVNGKIVTVPSRIVRKGDEVALKGNSLSSPLFAELDIRLKKYEPPKWLKLDKDKKTGAVVGVPETEDVGLTFDVTKIKEFYSR